MVASHSWMTARALILSFAATLALAPSSCAIAQHTPDKIQSAQPNPGDKCEEAAKAEDLAADALKNFMADCRAGKTGVQGEAGRERMKACLDEADEERLYSLGRDEFMAKCLKGE